MEMSSYHALFAQQNATIENVILLLFVAGLVFGLGWLLLPRMDKTGKLEIIFSVSVNLTFLALAGVGLWLH
jgi:hypothetical protein